MLKSLKYKLLIQQNKTRVYSYSFYLLKNRMDADDVTQEVFIKIWKNINDIKPGSATSWIMKTTHNLCIDYLRKRKMALNRECEIDDQFEEEVRSIDRWSDPEVEIRKNLLKEKIKNAVELLPEQLKSVFVMYELQGLKYKEISEILNIPMNSVKVYLLRARKKLQEELKEHRHEKIESY